MIDRLILSRIESLSALLQVFQLFRGRAEARLCDLFRSAVATLHKSHRLAMARFKVVAFVVLSVGLCKSRKDRLSPARTFVRPAPAAPYGLASSRFRSLFVKGCALPKNRPPPPRSRVLTDASASVLTSPSCPALRVGGCIIYVM